MNPIPDSHIAGLIYAGGRGVRMGGLDKALIKREGKPFIAHITTALSPFVSKIYITRQADQVDLSAFGLVLVDDEPDQGPLAGLVRAIREGRERGVRYLLTAAVDAPALPQDYMAKLQDAAKPHGVAMVGGHLFPNFAWIDLEKADIILEMFEQGERRLRAWVDDQSCGFAEFATGDLENINRL